MRLALAAALLYCSPALGQFTTAEWEIPTQYADGEPIPDGALVSTVVEYGTCPTPEVWGATIGRFVVPIPATSVRVPYVSGQTCARVKFLASDGSESGWSNVLRANPACVDDPLKLTVSAWPSRRTGSRRLSYSTGDKQLVSVTFTWPGTLTAVDTRGCSATASK